MSVFLQRVGLDWGTSTIRLYTEDGDEYLTLDQTETFSKFIQSMSARQVRRLAVRRFAQIYADGVILHAQAFSLYLRFVLQTSTLRVFPFTRVEMIVSLPTLCLMTTKQIFGRCLEDIGISKIIFTSSALASAIGAGFTYPFPQFSMILHLGESNSEITGLSFQECHFAYPLHFSGKNFRDSVSSLLFCRMGVRLSPKQLDTLWIHTADIIADSPTGKDTGTITKISGLVGEQARAVVEQLLQSIESLVLEIEAVLETLSVEEISSITQNGIVVTGGLGSQSELLRFLSSRLRIPLYSATNADECVIRGVSVLLQRHEA